MHTSLTTVFEYSVGGLQALGPLLGLPAQTILQEDGTRASLETVFQAIDADDSKSISKVYHSIRKHIDGARLIGL